MFAGILWKFGIGSSLREGFNLLPFTAHFSTEVVLEVSKTGLRYCQWETNDIRCSASCISHQDFPPAFFTIFN